MTRAARIVLAASAALIATGRGLAAPLPVDLTAYVGARNGADLSASTTGFAPATAPASASFGLGVSWFVRPDGWLEVFYDRQTLRFEADPSVFGTGRFDLDVDYLEFGGGYQPAEGHVRPYVTAAVGASRYGASSGQVQHSVGFAGSLGGGFTVPLGRKAAFRLELRGFATLTDAAIAATCGAGCSVTFAGSGWYQIAARAGVAFRL
jgi:hypothetical protein